MSRRLLGLLASIAAVYAVAITLLYSNSPPVPAQPKQSHYVILVDVCGQPEAVILTGEPPIIATRNQPPTREFEERIASIPEENVIFLVHRDWWCPSQPNEDELEARNE